MSSGDNILWAPTVQQTRQSEISRYLAYLKKNHHLDFTNYDQLYAWSIKDSKAFWSSYWDFARIVGNKGQRIVLDGDSIEKAQWFPDARLNYAENLLQKNSQDVAIFFKAEDKRDSQLSFQQLRSQVAAIAAWLSLQGVKKGDRVAALMGNIPQTVIAMLATTSLGAIWTSTSPDFGAQSVIERFGQTKPKILFTQDGYFYNGKRVDIRDKVQQIVRQVGSIAATVSLPFLGDDQHESVAANAWQTIVDQHANAKIKFVPCGFNDPLFILYSSGTTGKPKCITHKVGGSLIQHCKEHQLHADIRHGDVVFYFTTCGWMMWNWLVSALARGSSIALYDGSPFFPDGNVLFDYADQIGMTMFGTSAKYIDALNKHKYTPINTHHLKTIRTICSTGSVLSPESFKYVYSAIKSDVCLSSISGGTDILSCFVLGCPILPVRCGESQCRGLGMAVEVFDKQGNALIEEKGELVCTQSFPSQPAYFWADETGKKYHDAYFSTYENVWHHGDYVQLTSQGGVIIYGRSDATLNPGGVRIGTAEIYRHVEQLDEVIESVVIGQDWQNDVRVILFVVLKNGITLDKSLVDKIKFTIKTQCTPRHVPAKVIAVDDIPRTKSGKIVELAVREIVHGRPVNNIHALANPLALEQFKGLG